MTKINFTVDPERAKIWRVYLQGVQDPKYDSDDVIDTITVPIDAAHQVDIKLCNGDSPWVDAVLFRDGSEIEVLEPSDELLGEYHFNTIDTTIDVQTQK